MAGVYERVGSFDGQLRACEAEHVLRYGMLCQEGSSYGERGPDHHEEFQAAEALEKGVV